MYFLSLQLLTTKGLVKLLVLLSLFAYSSAIRFYLKANGKRCLREEVHKDVLVTGNYELSEASGQKNQY